MIKRTFQTLKSSIEAKATLIWLPHAGGSAAFFHKLSEGLPDSIECLAAEYPGRGRRITEPLSDDLMGIVYEISSAFGDLSDSRPIILFGHSLGARIGFEVCRHLRFVGSAVLPKLLIVSASEPPHVERMLPLFHRLPEGELVGMLVEMGGGGAVSAELAQELIWANLNVIRTDLRMGEMHRFIPTFKPNQNLTVYSGSQDAMVRRDVLDQWRRLFGGTTNFREFEGGHFYMHERQIEFLEKLRKDIMAQCIVENGDGLE